MARNQKLTVKITGQEKRTIRDQAELAGCATVSSYIRQLVLSSEPSVLSKVDKILRTVSTNESSTTRTDTIKH